MIDVATKVARAARLKPLSCAEWREEQSGVD
jgi:hypothetical protein